MPSHLCENRMAKLTLPVQGGSLPPPLSGLCSLPQHGEGQAGAPSPGPGRSPQDVKKIFSKQPGGRLALRRTPSFEGFPLLPPFLRFLATTGPSSLAAISFSSTVTQPSLACPGQWGGLGGAYRLLLAWLDEGDWTRSLDSPAWAYIQETFPLLCCPASWYRGHTGSGAGWSCLCGRGLGRTRRF